MRMPYWTRILFGVLLGAIALGALWSFVGIPWISATAAALLAAIGFLGSYFIWSADRPEEGYEQVLFDRPNTLVSALLILAFAGAGVGSGFLSFGSDAAAPAARTPADGVMALQADLESIAGAFEAGEKDAGATVDALLTLRDEADKVGDEIDTLPDGDAKDALIEAFDWIGQAIIQLKECAAGREDKCEATRASMADADASLRKWRTLSAAE